MGLFTKKKSKTSTLIDEDVIISELKTQHSKICAECKYFLQDKSNCRCFNPKQKDKDLISYCYWNFSCNLHEQGKRLTEEEMKVLGFVKKWNKVLYKSGGEGGYFYYEKIK
jgi:hypothetical protein